MFPNSLIESQGFLLQLYLLWCDQWRVVVTNYCCFVTDTELFSHINFKCILTTRAPVGFGEGWCLLRACTKKTTWAWLVISQTLNYKELQVKEALTSDQSYSDICFVTCSTTEKQHKNTPGLQWMCDNGSLILLLLPHIYCTLLPRWLLFCKNYLKVLCVDWQHQWNTTTLRFSSFRNWKGKGLTWNLAWLQVWILHLHVLTAEFNN